MIKAELIHNPYLLKTKAIFNGREPRINCQIEKYEDKPLKVEIPVNRCADFEMSGALIPA